MTLNDDATSNSHSPALPFFEEDVFFWKEVVLGQEHGFHGARKD
jgi:hypothetical protein